MHLAWVRDACHKNPLLFISADTGVRKILIGWAVKSNLLTCISKKQPWCRHRRKCLYSSGISFGRSKLLHLCGNFTFKPELEPNIIARLAGKEAPFSFLFRAFLPLPLPFWSLSRRLNIPFISLVLLKARERGRVLRARKRRARVLLSRVHRYLAPFISYPPATQVISQEKLVKLGCQITSRWMHAHFWKKYWKTFSLQRGVYYTLYLIMPYRGNVWQIIGIFYIYRVLLNFSFCDRCARKVTYSSVCWE